MNQLILFRALTNLSFLRHKIAYAGTDRVASVERGCAGWCLVPDCPLPVRPGASAQAVL